MTDTPPPPLCFVDTETTSLLGNRRAWEFAAIRVDFAGGEHREEFFIDLPSYAEADPTALRIGGFYERHPWPKHSGGATLVTNARSEEVAAHAIERITRGAVLVGSNPAFDAATLDPLLRRHGLIPSWHYAVRDIVPLVAGFLRGNGYGIESWKSEKLSRDVGVNPDDFARHTAMGDCEWTRAMYEAVMSA